MNLITDSHVWSAMVQALLHSLWQGALVSLLLFLGLKTIPVRFSNLRYTLALGSLVVIVLACLATWSWTERKVPPMDNDQRSVSRHVANTEFVVASAGGESADRTESLSPVDGEIGVPARGSRVGSADWTVWTGFVWVLGAAVFQFRLFIEMGKARKLVRRSLPVEDPAVLAAFSGVLERFKLNGRALIRRSDAVSIPAVWGHFKPVILVPSAYLTGLAPAQLEAIFAHELAHIRRHDFAINLVQRVLEGVFFFNPFVWWISRRVRIEREACCDLVAVETTGARVAYVRTLTAIAETGVPLGQPVPEPLMALGKERGQLLERMRRVLYPEGIPQLRLPFVSGSAVVLLCGISLFCLKVTTDAALDILSPEERMHRFTELRQAYPDYGQERTAARFPDDAEPVTVQGILRTHDNRPIPRGTWVYINTNSPGSSALSSAHVDSDGRFSRDSDPGTIYLGAKIDGYAPVFAGPLSEPEEWENVELVLEPGFEASIRLVDGDGNPVSGANVSVRYDVSANPWRVEAVSDADGLVSLVDLGEYPLGLDVEAAGYQSDFIRNVTLQPGQTFSHVLRPAETSGGVVVFEDTGEPVPGARIFLGGRSGPFATSYGRTESTNFLTETDDEGRFELRTLRDDARYHFLVTAPGATGIVAGPILAGERDLRFVLPRAGTAAVRVENVTSDDLDNDGRLQLTYSLTFRYGETSYGYSRRFLAEPDNAVAEFEVEPLWNLDAAFSVGEQTVQVAREDIVSLTDPVVIDLAEISTIEPKPEAAPLDLRIALRTLEDGVEARGSVLVEFVHDNRIQRAQAEVVDGYAEITIPNPRRVELFPSGLVGHWFAKRTLEIPADDSFLEVEVDLHPAGAIHGTVVEEGGEPAAGIMISVIPVSLPAFHAGTTLGVEVKRSTHSGDLRNRFMAAPLPFGGEYLICVYRGTTYVLSEPISVNPENPFREVKLTLPEGVEVAGRVLRPDGQPLAGVDVSFNFSATPSHGFAGRTAMTDREGRFSFSGVNPDTSGEYSLELGFRRDYHPVRRIVTAGERIEIQLEAGRVIEGQVIDHATGEPLEGVGLYAIRIPGNRAPGDWPWPTWFDPEAVTDSEGRFRFSTLPPGKFEINVRGGRVLTRDRTRESGAGDPIVLSIQQ